MARYRDLRDYMSSEYSNCVKVSEWVRDGHCLLLDGWTKCRAMRHQWYMGLRRALIQVPSEGTGLSTQGDAEVFALETIFAERAPLTLQELQVEVNSPSSVCR